MNPLRWSFRQFCLLGAVSCIALLAYALYAQHKLFLMPCPLCILQRIAFMVMGLGFAFGAVFGSRGWARWSSAALVFIGGSGGVGVAGRHVWLQNLPADEVPACGPGLEYMLQVFPLRDVLNKVFAGSGECAKLDWSFLGISMPGWTLLWYVGLMLATGYFLLRRPRER